VRPNGSEPLDQPVALRARTRRAHVQPRRGARLVGSLGRHAFLIIICLAAVYPLWFIASTALRRNADYQLDPTGLPTHPTLGSLRAMLFDEPLPRWMWNSFFVTVSAVALSTLVALLAAYAAAFGRFRGHRIFLSTSVALMVVPPITLVVPMFVLMVDTGWINHLQSVIVFYTGLLVPFAIFFLSNFFRTVPQELIEAAKVEGAGPFTVLQRVVLPLSGAATFTLVVVQAIWVWNELLIALIFLQNENSRTLMAGLTQFQGRFSTNEPLILSGALLSILPVVVLYLSGQRFFVRGLTAGIGK
jgi:raffinose/stachyose/melibiose transport system permease protein